MAKRSRFRKGDRVSFSFPGQRKRRRTGTVLSSSPFTPVGRRGVVKTPRGVLVTIAMDGPVQRITGKKQRAILRPEFNRIRKIR